MISLKQQQIPFGNHTKNKELRLCQPVLSVTALNVWEPTFVAGIGLCLMGGNYSSGKFAGLSFHGLNMAAPLFLTSTILRVAR